MASKQKKKLVLWDDESGEPAPFTPEDAEARLEAANDRMERENEDTIARLKEIDELLAREEAIAASLYATLAESMKAMAAIHARVAALTPPMRAIYDSKKRASSTKRRISAKS